MLVCNIVTGHYSSVENSSKVDIIAVVGFFILLKSFCPMELLPVGLGN